MLWKCQGDCGTIITDGEHQQGVARASYCKSPRCLKWVKHYVQVEDNGMDWKCETCGWFATPNQISGAILAGQIACFSGCAGGKLTGYAQWNPQVGAPPPVRKPQDPLVWKCPACGNRETANEHDNAFGRQCPTRGCGVPRSTYYYTTEDGGESIWACQECGYQTYYRPMIEATKRGLHCPGAGCNENFGNFVMLGKEEGWVPVEAINEAYEAGFMKKGENVVFVTFERRLNNLTFNVTAKPQVEEFMRALGNGSKKELALVNAKPTWTAVGDAPLEVYHQGMKINIPGFHLDNVGGPLQGENDSVNLSFLRLVGISKGGVSFKVSEVYSTSQLDKLQAAFANAFDKLYHEYIKPENRAVIVSTQAY